MSTRATCDQFVTMLAGAVNDAQFDALVAHDEQCPLCHSSLAKLADSSAPTDNWFANASPGPVLSAEDQDLLRRLRNAPPPQPAAASPNEDGATPATLPTIPGYDILKEIGRGGMGIVYEAIHAKLRRKVALKLLLSGQLASEIDVNRFRTEAEAAAGLQHPNIVVVYEAGEYEGRHYMTMEFVEGTNLATLVGADGMVPQRAARYIGIVAQAVHYAHERDILHRDLKPSNVLIDSSDQPRVTDFGLAKRVNLPSGLTATGQILGTPGYMPPEQIDVKRGTEGPTADVYALGASLYELLTGRRPFQATTAIDTLLQALTEEPVAPRLLKRGIDRDLETICLKCLRKDPRRRYVSSQELADDLGRFLRNEPILARPVGRTERTWLWCRRKPLAAGLWAAIACLLLGAVTFGYYHFTQLQIENRAHLLLNAQTLRKELESYGNHLDLAYALRLATRQGDASQSPLTRSPPSAQAARDRAFQSLKKASRIRHGPDVVGEAAALLAFADAWDVTALRGDPFLPNYDALHPILQKAGVSAVSRFGVRTWMFAEHTITTNPLPGNELDDLTLFAMSADNSFVARTVANGVEIRHWDAGNRKVGGLLRVQNSSTAIRALSFHPTAPSLAIAYDDGVVLWSFLEGTTISLGQFQATTIQFDPTGDRLAVGLAAGPIMILSTETGRIVQEHTIHRAAARRLQFRPDGLELAAVTTDEVLRRWSIDRPDHSEVFVPVSGIWGRPNLRAVAYSPCGRYVTAGGENRVVEVWDTTTGKLVLSQGNNFSDIRDIIWLPDQSHSWIAVACREDLVRFRVSFPTGYYSLSGSDHGAWVPTVAFSPDSTLLASASTDITLRIWDTTSGALLRSIAVGSGNRAVPWSNERLDVHPSLVFSPDGRHIAVGGPLEVMLFDVASGLKKASWPLERYAYQVLHYRPDGRLVAFQTEPTVGSKEAFERGEVATDVEMIGVIRDVASGDYLCEAAGLPDSLRIAPLTTLQVRQNNDGSRVVISGHTPRERELPVEERHLCESAYDLTDGTRSDLCFPDGEYVGLWPSNDGWWVVMRGQHVKKGIHYESTEIWKESTVAMRRVAQFAAKPSPGQLCSILLDGNRGLSFSYNGLGVWDVASKKELALVPWIADQSAAAYYARVSPDGSKLASGTNYGTVFLLDFPRIEACLRQHGLNW